MELRHLRHFVAVAEELHFARAAQRLGMEQSPLSQSIRNLESDLKVKLFHRTTRRTWLTRAGARFYDQAKRILADLDTARASLHIDDNEPALIRLALGEYLAGEPFTQFLFELEHHGLGAAAEIFELSHAEAARLVREGGADVAPRTPSGQRPEPHHCSTFEHRNEPCSDRPRGHAVPFVLRPGCHIRGCRSSGDRDCRAGDVVALF